MEVLGATELDAHLAQLHEQSETLQSELHILRQRDRLLHGYLNRLDEELRLAARLQQDLLPKSLPQLGRVRFHVLFRPASYVSGDIYDVMRLDEKHVAFHVADAVGHGMSAALLTMFIKRSLIGKETGPDGYRLLSPAEALDKTHQALMEQEFSHGSFVTALYGLIDTESLRFTFARAGHPHPILLRPAQPLCFLESPGALLGVDIDETRTDISVQLHPGDRLLFFTDGVEIAFNNDLNHGTTRWKTELDRRRHLPTDALLADFAACLDRESGSMHPKDDLTLLAMEVV